MPVIPPRYKWYARRAPAKVSCDVAARKIIFLLADGWRGAVPQLSFMPEYADEVVVWNVPWTDPAPSQASYEALSYPLSHDPLFESPSKGFMQGGSVAAIADSLVANYRPHIQWTLIDCDEEAIRQAVGDTCPVFRHCEFEDAEAFRRDVGREMWDLCIAAMHRR